MNGLFDTYFKYTFLYIEYSIVYVKYVTLYATRSISTSKYQMKTFPKNQPSNLGCYFLEKEDFFQTLLLSLVLAKPLYQNVCIDHRITSIFS